MTPAIQKAPEAKAATGEAMDVAEAFDDFMQAFEAFKQANDERIAQIENQVGEDVVTVEKMNRINQNLDEQKSLMDGIFISGQRPPNSGSSNISNNMIEHKKAFSDYFRRGNEENLRRFEKKALSFAFKASSKAARVLTQEPCRVGTRRGAIMFQ